MRGAVDGQSYSELLGATPGSLLIAGLGAIAIAMALIRYNKGDAPGRPPAPAAAS